jgi:hypothetical protein
MIAMTDKGMDPCYRERERERERERQGNYNWSNKGRKECNV